MDGGSRNKNAMGRNNLAGVRVKRCPQHVLLVEDEILIRLAAAEALRDLGLRVTEARSGAEGLDALVSDMRIDLLVTDIAMPGELDGLELAEACRAARPAVPIVLASARLPAPGDCCANRMIRKPYAVFELAAVVNELLQHECCEECATVPGDAG